MSLSLSLSLSLYLSQFISLSRFLRTRFKSQQSRVDMMGAAAIKMFLKRDFKNQRHKKCFLAATSVIYDSSVQLEFRGEEIQISFLLASKTSW